MKYILMLFIKIYQATLSLDHGLMGKLLPGYRVCIYHPSCSEYGYESIKRYGTFIGGYLTAKRIISCGPWSKGGYDPVKNLELNGFSKLMTKI